jgi:hypothetical protein
MVDPEVPVELVETAPYVSRGGEKLASALDAFGVDPAGRVLRTAAGDEIAFDKLLIDISPVIGIRFFVNGVLAATQATMPVASVVYAPITKIEKLAGITTRRVNVDYASWG